MAELQIEQQGDVLLLTANRPSHHNALTFEMYDEIARACDLADQDDGVRSLVLRGAGDRAFIAGTDIAQFAAMSTGADGLVYERRVARTLDRLEALTVPSVAVVQGYCMGGGLALAAVCDLRVATSNAVFGVPVARTVGNCLSMNTYSLLLTHFGHARTLDMLLRARHLDAEEAHRAGFVCELTTAEDLQSCTERVLQQLREHAPLSMWAAKTALARLRRAGLPTGDDLVERVFASEDFRHGVSSFLTHSTPRWSGR